MVFSEGERVSERSSIQVLNAGELEKTSNQFAWVQLDNIHLYFFMANYSKIINQNR